MAMDQPQDLAAARRTFIEAVTAPAANAATITHETAEAISKAICRTANVCTNANIQHSKGLILAHLSASTSRMTALSTYLVSVCKLCPPRDPDVRIDTTKPGDENEGLGKIVNGKVQQPPEAAYKRLHLLYLFHDVIMTVLMHGAGRQQASGDISVENLRPYADALVRLASCSGTGGPTSTMDAALDVVSIWRQKSVFGADLCDDMAQHAQAARGLEWSDLLAVLATEESKSGFNGAIDRSFDWIMPYRHGAVEDTSAAWHELPAANALYLKRTRGYPLRAAAIPDGGFGLDGGDHAAAGDLKAEVGALYKQIMQCNEKYTDAEEVQDVDALGNIIWKDADRPTRNYWGWTLDGIERRKELAARSAQHAKGYGDLPNARPAGVNDAVERAKALAIERANSNGSQNSMSDDGSYGADFGRGGFRGGRGGFRGGGNRGDFRGSTRGRPRW